MITRSQSQNTPNASTSTNRNKTPSSRRGSRKSSIKKINVNIKQFIT